MFERLKITAHMQTAIVSDETLPIDGVLYYYSMKIAYGSQLATLPGGHIDKNQKRAYMPLLLLNQGDRWFYAASFAQWGLPVAEYTDYWNKRYRNKLDGIVDFRGKRGKIVLGEGRYKAYRMPVFARHTLNVSWYVVGDIDGIKRLLSCVSHIGKKSSQGFGAVLKWDIEKIDYDWSVYNSSGKLMRAIPQDAVEDFPGKLLYCGYRPSYWDTSNQAMCAVP